MIRPMCEIVVIQTTKINKHASISFSLPGSPSDQQAGQGHRVDGAQLPSQAQAHHAGARDPVRAGELSRCHICNIVSRDTISYQEISY